MSQLTDDLHDLVGVGGQWAFASAVALAIGFLSWAFYFVAFGLEYTRLERQQYFLGAFITIGYAVAAFLVSVLAAFSAAFLMKEAPDSWDQKPAGKSLRLIQTMAFGLLLGFALWQIAPSAKFGPALKLTVTVPLLVAVGALEMFARLKIKGRFVEFLWRFFYGIWTALGMPLAFAVLAKVQNLPLTNGEYLVGFFCLTVPGIGLSVFPPFKMKRYARREFVFGRTKAKTPAQPRVHRPWRELVRLDRDTAVIQLTFLVLFASAGAGAVILPHMPVQIGGAQAHNAKFVVMPNAFDNETRAQLLGNRTWIFGVAVKTENLTVVFRNSDLYFVRLPGDYAHNGRSYEIQRSAVVAVQWYAD